ALAGRTERTDLDGRSFVALLGDDPPPAEHWRQAYLLEHTEEPTLRLRRAGSRLYRIPPHLLEPPDPPEPLIQPHSYLPAHPSLTGSPLHRCTSTQITFNIAYHPGARYPYAHLSDPAHLSNRVGSVGPASLPTLSESLRVLRGCAGAGCRAADQTAP